MSTLTIDFQTQVLDFGPLTRGRIEISIDIGTSVDPFMTEILTTGVAQNGYFQEAAYNTSSPILSNIQQANYFAFAFNRDYKNIGGTKNLSANSIGNGEVVITAKVGTFNSFNYTGNVLIVNGTIDNSAQPTPVTFSAVRSPNVGSCSTIEYTLTATGDDTPFKVFRNGIEVITGWNGTAQTLNLIRGIPQRLDLRNNVDALIGTISQIVPRTLVASEFQEQLTQYPTYSDILIVRTVTVAGTDPIEYALTPPGDSVGSGYQASNSFTGIAPGQYRLWIKDAYGCERSRLITVPELLDATESDVIRYFLIPEGQSIAFAELPTFDKDTKKNYFNTGSYNELVRDARYCIKQFYDPSDLPQGIQFQSSYDFHQITLHGADGSAIDLTPVQIQQNLGVIERVDCMRFAVGTKTGIYFQGGNTYVADTNTALPDPSPYDGTTPRWGVLGQLISLDGIGSFVIEQTGYDSDRGGYFVIDSPPPTTDTAAIVQVTYNAHPYNLYEVYFNPADLTEASFIVIEKGFAADEIDGNQYVSDVIASKVDQEDDIRIQWADTKNRGNLVFQSGIQFLFRRYGEFYGDFTNTEAEVYAGDDQIYSLDQSAYLDFTLRFEMLSAKQVNMLNIASGLETFNVNGINLVRKDPPTIVRYGKSNMHTWEGTFGFGGNQIGIIQDEVVLSVNTGVVGGGSTGTSQAPDLSGIILFKNSDGELIKLQTGALTKQ